MVTQSIAKARDNNLLQCLGLATLIILANRFYRLVFYNLKPIFLRISHKKYTFYDHFAWLTKP